MGKELGLYKLPKHQTLSIELPKAHQLLGQNLAILTRLRVRLSNISNNLIIQAEELSDADIDSIYDGNISNSDNVLNIIKDLKNLPNYVIY